MFGVKLICVGRMRERFYIDAFEEYRRRLAPHIRLEITEQRELLLPDEPSESEIETALMRESKEILSAIPRGAHTVAMAIEGKQLSSEDFAGFIRRQGDVGTTPIRLCFVVGGSFGLHDSVKASANTLLSLSKMTLPHHLARVVLIEQIYRAAMINTGSKYHK